MREEARLCSFVNERRLPVREWCELEREGAAEGGCDRDVLPAYLGMRELNLQRLEEPDSTRFLSIFVERGFGLPSRGDRTGRLELFASSAGLSA